MIFQAYKESIEYKVSCIELRKKKRKDTKKCYPLFFYLATHIRFTLIKESIELRKRGKTKTILLSFQLLSQKFTQL